MIDEESRTIDELESFITLQTILLKRLEMLAASDFTQEDADTCDILLSTVAKHFARTVQTESTPAKRAAYAMELLVQTLTRLGELGRTRGQAVIGPTPDEMRSQGTEELYQEIVDKTPREEFRTLETIYGASCTRIVNQIM